MPRIRSVKPEFFSSEPVGNCSPTSRLLFIALWCWADDDGRMVDNARVIRSFAFPLDDTISSADVEAWLTELHAARLIVRYENEGRKYLCVKNFKEHQHPKKPTPSALPSPPEWQEFPTSSPLVPHQFPTGGASRGEESRVEEGRGVGGELATADADRPPLGVVRGERVPAGKGKGGKRPNGPKWPNFPDEARRAVYEAWTSKLGAVGFATLIGDLAPLFRSADDPNYIPHDALVKGVRDYAGMITRGRSAPFASPRDCAKRLVALARLHVDMPNDPIGRADQVEMILHGRVTS